MGVNITTIVYLRVLIIQIGSTIILMVVEAQGKAFWFGGGVGVGDQKKGMCFFLEAKRQRFGLNMYRFNSMCD